MQNSNIPTDNTLSTTISIQLPFVTKARFSELTGLSEDAIRGMIQRGYIPSIKLGKNRLINLALVTKYALEKETLN